MTTTSRERPRLTRTVAATFGATLLVLGAAACGGANDGNAADATGEQLGQQQGGPQNSRSGAMPGAVGKVAAVAGKTAQVQGMQGQVAVSWTGSTTFTKEVAATLAEVKVGRCVLVSSADQGSEGSSGGSGSASPPTAVTAAEVRISPSRNGTCGPAGRGPAGGPAGDGSQLQGTPPSGAPQGGQRPQLRGIAGAVGKVTAVSATGFTVASTTPGSDGGDDSVSVTVTVGAGTTYTSTVRGAASDVKVGVCVQADGTPDDTGAVTATRIAVSAPRNGECGGMVRMGPAAGNGPGGQES